MIRPEDDEMKKWLAQVKPPHTEAGKLIRWLQSEVRQHGRVPTWVGASRTALGVHQCLRHVAMGGFQCLVPLFPMVPWPSPAA